LEKPFFFLIFIVFFDGTNAVLAEIWREFKLFVMINLNVNIDKVLDFVSREDINKFQAQLEHHHKSVLEKTGAGNDYLGWVELPSSMDNELLLRIEADAQRIRKIADVFVVIGIGGSYLGARAVIEALDHNFSSLLDDRKNPLVIYAGNNIGEDYISDLLDVLDRKDYALAVISKSGTTTEPAIAFRILKNHLEEKYGKAQAKDRIIAITDESRGALKQLADNENQQGHLQRLLTFLCSHNDIFYLLICQL